MTTNIFISSPVKVVILDPIKGVNRRTFVFLGDVPKNVWNACNYYHMGTSAQRCTYDKLLREFYGSDFKSKLGLDIKDYSRAWISTPERIEIVGSGKANAYTETGTFTHNGDKYDINCALLKVANQPIHHIPVRKLVWILAYMPAGYFDDPKEKIRVDSCDISTPILVTNDDKYGIVVLDGIHRLKKANNIGVTELPAREISSESLMKCKISMDSDPVRAYEMSEFTTTYDTPEEQVDVVRVGSALDDEIDDSDIEALLNTPTQAETAPTKTAKAIVSNVSMEDLRVNFEPGIEYITDIHVYPEDKFNELKDKVYLATNIPTYRQHMFYIDNNRLQTVYKIHAEGLYNVDIRRINQSRNNIHGVPIDKDLYDIRNSIRVEALDMFKIVSDSISGNNIVYVVDLAQFTHKLQSQLMEVVNDTYQFELFYYGFVIKFWPQLTQECFYDYMIAEPELQHKYPDLAKNKAALAAIYRTEKEIIDYNYKNMTKALSYAENAGVTIAITQMIATVSGNRVMLNIRNLFDKLRVTRCIPEIHAYIEHNNKRYLLRKRHIRNGSDIQFPSGALMKNGITIAISLRKSDQESFHSKSTISTMENEQSRYLFLNIWSNGRYYVRTVWNEEDELGFNDIIRIMKKFTDPIIHGINNLGRFAFIAGDSLPLITKQNINYQGLNICVFWKKVMLENTFKVIKSLWEPFMRARITGPRNVQQFDKYEFLFRKGMYEFDTNAIERIITASNNIILSNYYAYLSNNTIKQKWDQNYDGRIVRMSHRTTDVRFEISDIREREFQLFYTYIVLFVYRAVNDEKVKASLMSTKSYKDVKKLRKLREQDPELYNLKKYGSKKVYSIICQNQRQPLIYTPDELKNIPAAEVKKLTQYWNFTMNKPAYYGCPNKKYPHLSFMVNAHPKHYCLPCCNKKPQLGDETKKTRINSVCLQKHKYVGDESLSAEVGISRHIMNYGKDIDLGRLSKLPQTSIKNLLFGTLGDNNLNYYLYGVPQHVPGVENIGIIYSVAESINIPMEELIKKIIYELKKSESDALFNTLLNGTLSDYFLSISDLITSIKDIFLDMKMFSKEIQKFKQWPELFTELFHVLFKISIFTFIDEDGSGGNIDLFVPDMLRNEILYISNLAAIDTTDTSDPTARGDSLVSSLMAEQIYIILIKKQNRYYPIFIIDAEKYFKTFEVEIRKYGYDDKVIQLLYNMVKYNARGNDLSIDKRQDLSVLKQFTMKNPEYKMIKKFINKQNLCYAILLSNHNENVYVPIEYSVYVSDNIEISFNAFIRSEYKLTLGTLNNFITVFNRFIKTEFNVNSSTELYSYKMLTPREYISIVSSGTTTAGVVGFTTDNDFIFYFNSYAEDDLNPQLPVKTLKYDYNEINKLILARTAPIEDNRTKLIGEALYTNYLYQLFVIEFINYLDKERNTILRSKIKSLINETNFKKDIGAFRKETRALLKEYPADYNIVQNQLIAFYYTYFNKALLLEQIDATIYDFDRVTMNRLRKLTRDELKSELKIIAENFSVQKDFDSTGIQFPNIYMPCSEMTDATGYCEKNKLILNRPIDDFVDILATDLMDDLKSKYLLNNLWMDTVINYLRFTKWPTEIVSIYRLTE